MTQYSITASRVDGKPQKDVLLKVCCQPSSLQAHPSRQHGSKRARRHILLRHWQHDPRMGLLLSRQPRRPNMQRRFPSQHSHDLLLPKRRRLHRRLPQCFFHLRISPPNRSIPGRWTGTHPSIADLRQCACHGWLSVAGERVGTEHLDRDCATYTHAYLSR